MSDKKKAKATRTTRKKTGKAASDKAALECMRAVLLQNKCVNLSTGYLKREFIERCINALEGRLHIWGIGLDAPTPLEKLAMHCLTESAYLTE